MRDYHANDLAPDFSSAVESLLASVEDVLDYGLPTDITDVIEYGPIPDDEPPLMLNAANSYVVIDKSAIAPKSWPAPRQWRSDAQVRIRVRRRAVGPVRRPARRASVARRRSGTRRATARAPGRSTDDPPPEPDPVARLERAGRRPEWRRK